MLKILCTIVFICSAIITFLYLLLLWLDLRNDKYLGKLVEETPILKYLRVIEIGGILITVFGIIQIWV